MQPFEILEWDSAFFGFPVARLDAALRSREGLEQAVSALRGRGVQLAYWLPPLENGLERLVGNVGGTLVGTHVRYERELEDSDAADAGAGAPIGVCEAVTPQIEALAVQAGEFSRFGADPAMPPGTVERMYGLWIRRSLSGPMGDEILVAADTAGPAGLITLKYRPPEAEIGLVAVAKRARRSGLGRALMQAAHRRYRERSIRRGIVVTQGENRAARRLYEACGYTKRRVSLAAHFWLSPRR